MLMDEFKKSFKSGDMLMRLIYINVAVYIIAILFSLFSALFNLENKFIINLFAASSSLSSLIFKPWSVITYMFLHLGIWHILSNMIILYFSGRIFMGYIGEKKLLSTYLIGGLAGFALYFISYNIFPAFKPSIGTPILGASASVMAVFIGIATYVPNLPVRLFVLPPIKLKYIAMAYVFLDLAGLSGEIGVPGGNPGGRIAHLGGAMFGYLAMSNLSKGGKDLNAWMEKILNSIFRLFKKRKPKMKVHRNTNYQSSPPPRDDHKFNENKVAKQKRIDEILDKISQSGYDSLTKEEKKILFEASNE
jgi:membrane associated rhomboid family serine protease